MCSLAPHIGSLFTIVRNHKHTGTYQSARPSSSVSLSEISETQIGPWTKLQECCTVPCVGTGNHKWPPTHSTPEPPICAANTPTCASHKYLWSSHQGRGTELGGKTQKEVCWVGLGWSWEEPHGSAHCTNPFSDSKGNSFLVF